MPTYAVTLDEEGVEEIKRKEEMQSPTEVIREFEVDWSDPTKDLSDEEVAQMQESELWMDDKNL